MFLNNRRRQFIWFGILVMLQFCFIGAIKHATAASEGEVSPDRLKFRLSSYNVFDADTDIAVFSSSGAGATVNFGDDLGGEKVVTIPRLDGYYRFNEYHRIDFTVFKTDRSGLEVLDLNVDLGEESYVIGDLLETDIKFSFLKLGYAYSFFHSPDVELSFTVGLNITEYDFSFGLENGGQSGSTGASAPLPTYGFRMAYNIDSNWSLYYVSETFFIHIDDELKGALLNYELDLEYRFDNSFVLGAGISRISADLDVSSSDWQGRLADSNRGLLIYLAYYL